LKWPSHKTLHLISTKKTQTCLYLKQILCFNRWCQSVLPIMWCFVKHCFNFSRLLHDKCLVEGVTYKPWWQETKSSINFINHIPKFYKYEHPKIKIYNNSGYKTLFLEIRLVKLQSDNNLCVRVTERNVYSSALNKHWSSQLSKINMIRDSLPTGNINMNPLRDIQMALKQNFKSIILEWKTILCRTITTKASFITILCQTLLTSWPNSGLPNHYN
jgi:hypothetical protein